MQRLAAIALVLVVVTATVPAAVAGAGATAVQPSAADETATFSADGTAQSNAYAGTHVAFEASGGALTDYSVGGDVVLASVETQSQSEFEAESGVDVGLDASAVTGVAGVDLTLDATTSTRAEVRSEGSASMTAHDTERGILTVHAGEDAQYVEVGVSGEAESDDGDRVVVRDGDRTGAFVVAGDGEVAVNDDGNVTADLGSDATLVFRSYDGERDDDAREQERLIAEGTATAEVYADERDGERVADAATYGSDLTVDASSEAQNRVDLTVDRAESEGTVVITTVSEAAIEGVERADDVTVTVDGEAAAQASSHGELAAGIGEEPRYMVTQSGSGSASADVLVAVDHFSERDVTIQESDGSGDGTDGGSEDGSDGGATDSSGQDDGSPGFGVVGALLGLLGALGARLRA